MNNGLILLFIGMTALFMGAVPYAYFQVVSLTMGLPIATSVAAKLGLLGLCAVIMYAASLGACAMTQRSNCGSIKDIKAVAADAGIAMAIQVGLLLIGLFIPGLNHIISGYFCDPASPGTPGALWNTSVDAGYWSAWGAAYGIAVGATMAGSC
jgi:hypothetical protein